MRRFGIILTDLAIGAAAPAAAQRRIDGDLLLAPTDPPTIQALRLRVAP